MHVAAGRDRMTLSGRKLQHGPGLALGALARRGGGLDPPVDRERLRARSWTSCSARLSPAARSSTIARASLHNEDYLR